MLLLVRPFSRMREMPFAYHVYRSSRSIEFDPSLHGLTNEEYSAREAERSAKRVATVDSNPDKKKAAIAKSKFSVSSGFSSCC